MIDVNVREILRRGIRAEWVKTVSEALHGTVGVAWKQKTRPVLNRFQGRIQMEFYPVLIRWLQTFLEPIHNLNHSKTRHKPCCMLLTLRKKIDSLCTVKTHKWTRSVLLLNYRISVGGRCRFLYIQWHIQIVMSSSYGMISQHFHIRSSRLPYAVLRVWP